MRDLKSPAAIYLKAGLFVFLGIASGALLILDAPTLRTVGLLALCIWSFCRAYYFAFYVIEHYVDSSYKFSGLIHFLQYVMRRKRS